MKKIMPLAASIALILVAGIFASAGTLAIFTDMETGSGNTFTAGTLDLTLGGSITVPISLSDLKPGDGIGGAEHSTISYQFTVANLGTLDGILTMTIVNVRNYENGRNEPEKLVDTTGGIPGLGNGELGDYLIMKINVPGPGGFYYGLQGCGKPNCGSIIPAGASHTINCWENHVVTVGTLPGGVSWSGQPGVLEFALPSSVGNVIQSDSVVFDVLVSLTQA